MPIPSDALKTGTAGIPLNVFTRTEYDIWLEKAPSTQANWVRNQGFKGKGHCLIPGPEGELAAVLCVLQNEHDAWPLGEVATQLPAGDYHLHAPEALLERAALSWLLGAYRFDRYRTAQPTEATLWVEQAALVKRVSRLAEGVALVRDLVNTPASDMMPEHLSEAMIELANQFGGHVQEVVGDDLLTHNYPTIHMVGRASVHAPRLLDMRWGDDKHPGVTLVGKGVCFDSGGLDIKPANGMRLMKKDMGGAAHVLGLAHIIMSLELPIKLRVLIPAVENAISSNAFRPGDVVKTRKGLTVEIDNTDAEGRLVLCDALAEADTEQPDLLIDFATLTGAARVALGTELPGFFSDSSEIAHALQDAGIAAHDPVWQLPLHEAYNDFLKSDVADLVNCAPTPFGGAITAALYLKRFVEQSPWVHFDVMAWNQRALPGRPVGGEAMGIRAVFELLERRYR
ncbi:MAG: leucyl aminopeptidase family protein [Saccharospirillum sp.]|nr:leucyl aminopeptidase family protein [Saccharospirillum sp.]